MQRESRASLEADGALGAGRATADFQNLHRNKRSLTLNLKAPEGRALLGYSLDSDPWIFRKLAELMRESVEQASSP